MVLFSIERFVAVYFPIKLKQILSKKRAIKLILLFLLMAFVFYLYIARTKDIERIDSSMYVCKINELSEEKLLNLIKFDTIFSVLTPFALITLMNILIVYRLKKSPLRNLALSVSSNQDSECKYTKIKHEIQNNPNLTIKLNIGKERCLQKLIGRRVSRSTRIFLVLSFSFVILNFPLAVFRIFYFNLEIISSMMIFGNETENLVFNLSHRICIYINYITFALNYYLYNFYSLNQRSWRKILLSFISKHFKALKK
jgi:hypothetical protein